MTVDYLARLADDLLDAAEAALVQATTGYAPPTHAYVAHRLPPADLCCDDGMLVVYLDHLDHQSFGAFGAEPPPQNCATTPQATFHIVVRRCYPAHGATDDRDTAAQKLLGDLWAILTEVYDRRKSGALFPDTNTLCTDVTVGDVQPEDVEGGCGGYIIPVTTVCNDTGPTGS